MSTSSQIFNKKDKSTKYQEKCHRVLCPIRHPVGGIRTYLHYNYPRLLEAGFRFTFVAPDNKDFQVLREEMGNWPEVEFVGTRFKKGECQLWSSVRNELKKGKYSVIHSQGLTAGVQAIFGNMGINVPHVITSHDVFRPNQFQGVTGQLKRIMLGRILFRANVLITVSHDAERNHLDYLPVLKKGGCQVMTILNGIETNKFGAELKSTGWLRKKLQISPDVFLMGFMGRFMEQKGFLPLIHALEKLDKITFNHDFHLVAVGSGDYVREYKQYVNSKSTISEKVSFIERVANSSDILKELDLLVMPSLWEACGLLAMEAMCLGIPVLGSDCRGLREVLEGTPSIITCAGNSHSLAEGIQEFFKSPNQETAWTYAAIARHRFDVNKAAKDLLLILNDQL